MFSAEKRKYLKMLGYSGAQIAALEAGEARSKARPNRLAELVYKELASGQPAGDGGRLGALVREKLTKDAKTLAGPTPSPLVNALIANGATN